MGMTPRGPALVNPAPPQRNWWSRNWKWLVPAVFVLIIAMVVLFVAGVVTLALGSIKATEPYQYALHHAQSSPTVVERLGTPIVEAGLGISGNVNLNGASGDADLAIPISGPKGKATVYVVGSKSAGRWSYRTLEVQFEGDPKRLDLLAEPPPGSNR